MRVLDTGRVEIVASLLFLSARAILLVGTDQGRLTAHDLSGVRPPIRLPVVDSGDPSRGGLVDGGDAVYTINSGSWEGYDADTGKLRTADRMDFEAVPGLGCGAAASADGLRRVTEHGLRGTFFLAGWVSGPLGWARTWLVEQGVASRPELNVVGDRVVQIGCRTPGRWDYQLLLRDTATGELVAAGGYPYSMLARPHFRPDGRQVVAARDSLVVWDTRAPGKSLLVKNDSRRHFTAAAYHPSGRYLFTTSNDATVTVWDTDNWVRVKRFDWNVGQLRSVAVSPDGLLAAAGSDRGRVVVWDVDV